MFHNFVNHNIVKFKNSYYFCRKILAMDKPFIFGVPVEDSHFIGRKREINRLTTNFKYGVNTVLISPRRWGKTSLVNKVAGMTASKELLLVRMDIFSCRNEYDFYNVFSEAILKQTASKVEEWKDLAKGFIERLAPKISMSLDPLSEYSLSLGITSKTHTPEEVLQLPETIAQRKGCHLLICIDEFQQVGEFPDSLTVQKRMRSVWQHQNNVSYCLYGSKMHMMTNLFQKKSYPFYKFGEMLYLKPISLDAWKSYISDRFEQEGKHISGELIQKLCEIVEYHSSYVQQLAYCALLLTQNEVTEEILAAAIEDLISQNSSFFIEQTQSLTSYQLNFLRAILYGVNNGFNEKEVRESFNLGVPSNVDRLKKSLVNKELIEYTEKGVEIGDPVLRLWLKRVLF